MVHTTKSSTSSSTLLVSPSLQGGGSSSGELGDILRAAALDNPASALAETLDSSVFQILRAVRTKEVLADNGEVKPSFQRLITKCSRDEAGEALKLLTEVGVAGDNHEFRHFSGAINILLKHASPEAIGEIAGGLSFDATLSETTGFQGNLRRGILRAVSKRQDLRPESLFDLEKLERALLDITERSHERKFVDEAPHLTELARDLVHALALHGEAGALVVEEIAATTLKRLTEKGNYRINVRSSSGSMYGEWGSRLGFDADDSFDSGAARRNAAESESGVSLLDKVRDDLSRANTIKTYEKEFRGRRYKPSAGEAEWRQWAKRRVAQASLYVAVLGAAASHASDHLKATSAELLLEYSAVHQSQLMGAVIHALGEVTRALPGKDLICKYFQMADRYKWYGDSDSFIPKGSWLNMPLDRATRQLTIEDLLEDVTTFSGYREEAAPFYQSYLPRLMSHEDSRIRAAAFKKCEELLFSRDESKWHTIVQSTGLLESSSFYHDAEISYPSRVAGKASSLLRKLAKRTADPFLKRDFATAALRFELTAKDRVERARSGLSASSQPFREITEELLSLSDDLPREDDLLLEERRMSQLSEGAEQALRIIQNVFESPYRDRMSDQMRYAVGEIALQLLPYVDESSRGEMVELLIVNEIASKRLLREVEVSSPVRDELAETIVPLERTVRSTLPIRQLLNLSRRSFSLQHCALEEYSLLRKEVGRGGNTRGRLAKTDTTVGEIYSLVERCGPEDRKLLIDELLRLARITSESETDPWADYRYRDPNEERLKAVSEIVPFVFHYDLSQLVLDETQGFIPTLLNALDEIPPTTAYRRVDGGEIICKTLVNLGRLTEEGSATVRKAFEMLRDATDDEQLKYLYGEHLTSLEENVEE